MTVREILSAMFRRWYIPLGVLACAALVTFLLARDGGVYTTSTVVSFMRPATTSLSPTNGTNDSSVIAFAGAVAEEVNNGRTPARYSTDDAPFYGAGVREGVLVVLANAGNQWVSEFDRAEVKIHVVGPTFDWVKSRQEELVEKVLGIAEAQQLALAASPGNHISAAVVPLTLHIEYVSPSRGSQFAAGAAIFAAALIVGAWGAIEVERLLSKRRAGAGTVTLQSTDHALGESTS